jgi:hypothetical protein
MQVVQLSDIHVGSFFKQQVFDTVVEETYLSPEHLDYHSNSGVIKVIGVPPK